MACLVEHTAEERVWDVGVSAAHVSNSERQWIFVMNAT